MKIILAAITQLVLISTVLSNSKMDTIYDMESYAGIKNRLIRIQDVRSANKKEGSFIEFYDAGNNKMALTGYYYENKKSGIWTYYDVDGNIILKEEYYKGVLYNTQYLYHQNGKIKTIIPFEDGKIQGVVLYYNKNGDFAFKLHFINGNQIKNIKDFNKKYYTDNADTVSFKRNKGAGASGYYSYANGFLKAYNKIVLDTVSCNAVFCKTSKTINKEIVHCKSNGFDSIEISIFNYNVNSNLKTAWKNYVPKSNEIAFFYKYPIDTEKNNNLFCFKKGELTDTALKSEELNAFNLVVLFKHAIFKMKDFPMLLMMNELTYE